MFVAQRWPERAAREGIPHAHRGIMGSAGHEAPVWTASQRHNPVIMHQRHGCAVAAFQIPKGGIASPQGRHTLRRSQKKREWACGSLPEFVFENVYLFQT